MFLFWEEKELKDIYDLVQTVISEHGTRDPFDICADLNILLIITDLDSLQGMLAFIDGVPVILISSKIDERQQRIVCAHELGHFFLHSEIVKEKCLREFEIFNMCDKIEYEANVFACHLLIDEDEMLEHFSDGYTAFEVAMMLGYNVDLLSLKMNEMNGWGYNFDVSWGNVRKLFE